MTYTKSRILKLINLTAKTVWFKTKKKKKKT